MNSKEFVLSVMRKYGEMQAKEVQAKSGEMTGTELYSENNYLPRFVDAVAKKNMKNREIGFVCLSPAGRVVKLSKKYDSEKYPQEPEELEDYWGYVWSTDPSKALPYISLKTAPYNVSDCCTEGGKVYRCLKNNTKKSPSESPKSWEEVQ